MIQVFGVLLRFCAYGFDNVVWNFVTLIAAIAWLRLLAAVTVRESIQMSGKKCLEVLQQLNGEPVIFMGFSWGGAVSRLSTTPIRLENLLGTG